MAPHSLPLHSSGVAIWAFLACSAGGGSGGALVLASDATDVQLRDIDLSCTDGWNNEGLEADVSLLQMDFRFQQQKAGQRLAHDSEMRLPKGAPDMKRFDRIRVITGVLVFGVVSTLALLGVAERSDGKAIKSKVGKGFMEKSGCQEEPEAEAPPVAEKRAEDNDLSVRFDFISRVLEDKVDTHEVDVSGSNSDLLYGLYMQATCGDVRGRRPWVLRAKDRAKWDSWAKQRGQSPAVAMATYIEAACNAMQDRTQVEGYSRAKAVVEDEQSEALRKQFEKAALDLKEKIRSREVDPPVADLVTAYGLYKQASCGDNQGAQPWAYNINARAKWDSWSALTGMSSSEAMEKYVGVVERLLAAQ